MLGEHFAFTYDGRIDELEHASDISIVFNLGQESAVFV